MKFLFFHVIYLALYAMASEISVGGENVGVSANLSRSVCTEAEAEGAANMSKNITALTDEINALEELIELQTRKLGVLQLVRQRLLAGESLPPSYATKHTSSAANPPRYSAVPPTSSSSLSSQAASVSSQSSAAASAMLLLPMSQLELNQSTLWNSIMTVKLPKRGERTLVASLSSTGELILFDRTTMQVVSEPIPTQLTSISASAYDGMAEGRGNLVLCSDGGEVVILAISAEPRPAGPPKLGEVRVEITARYSVPSADAASLPAAVTNEASLRNHEYATTNGISPPTGDPYATTANIYHGGSSRGVSVYLGDSMGRLLQYHLNGTLVQWLAVDHYRPLRRMSRIGQVLTIPVGNQVLMYHVVKLGLRPRVCLGGTEDFTDVVIDARALTHAIAMSTSGSLYSFNTKFQESGETICKLSQIVPAVSTDVSNTNGRSLVSLRGHLAGVARGCSVAIYDSSRIRYQRDGIVLAATVNSCDVTTHSITGIEVAPISYVDGERRLAKDFTLLVSAISSNTTKLVVYNTALPDIEEDINELAWLKLPMMGVAVAAFLVYKYFAMNKKDKKAAPMDKFGYPRTSPRSGKHGREIPGFSTSNHGIESERLREEIDRLTARAKQMSGKFQ